MNTLRKLRRGTVVPVFEEGIAVLLVFFVIAAGWGRGAAFNFMVVVWSLVALLSAANYLRTRNSAHLVALAFFAVTALFVGGLSSWFHISNRFTAVMGILFISLAIWVYYLLFTRHFHWRGREILELAAQPVDDVTDGFTARPYPLGKTDHAPEDLLEFSRFARKFHMAVPRVEPDRIVFVTPTAASDALLRLHGLRHNYADQTWVAFDRAGNITVNITKGHYDLFRESLSFEKLCQSLGNLFSEFLAMYARGDGKKIIDRLNSVRENPFT